MAKAALECWTRELSCHLGPEGHRINAISSAQFEPSQHRVYQGFDRILDHVEENAPLRRNVSQEDVAGTAIWLASHSLIWRYWAMHHGGCWIFHHDGSQLVSWKIREEYYMVSYDQISF